MIIGEERNRSIYYHSYPSLRLRGIRRGGKRNWTLSSLDSIRQTVSNQDFIWRAYSGMERSPLLLNPPFENYLINSFVENLRPRRHLHQERDSPTDQSPFHSPTKSSSFCASDYRDVHSNVNNMPIEIKDSDSDSSRQNFQKSSSEHLDVECIEIVDDDVSFISSDKNFGRKPMLQNTSFQGKEKDKTILTTDLKSKTAMKEVKSGISRGKDTLIGGANKLQPVPDDTVLVLDDVDSSSLGLHHFDAKKDIANCPGSSSLDKEEKVISAPDYPIYIALKKKLAKECRQIDFIRGDGNCFFRTISKELNGSERYHLMIRNLIVDLIATNKEHFAQFVDGGDVQDHVERMCQEQSWATTCEIYAASTLLQRDIYMLTPDHLNSTYSWLLFKPVFQRDTQDTGITSHPCYITMCNTNGNHYDRIVPEHGGCNCFLPHPELEGISYSVDLTDDS